MIPYCVSIFDGKTTTSIYLTYYTDSDEMLKASIIHLMKRKYNKVYLKKFS